MIGAWTSNLKDEESKAKFEKKLLGSRAVLNRLKELLKESETDLNNYETTAKGYDSPSWAFKQADNNGFRRCLKFINKLIDLDQQQFQTTEKL
jgi:hypothetical protein